MNRERAEQIAYRLDDRDRALFFVGREAALDSFNRALEVAEEKGQTVFRVFRGAPGSGKTSLVHHIQEIHESNPRLLFVKADDHMASKAHLVDRIAEVAARRPFERTGALVNDAKEFFARYMTTAAMAASETIRMKTASAALAKWRRAHALDDGFTVVLTFDEAQALDRNERKVLRSLHKTGIEGVKSVILLAGLSHTDRALAAAGISRRSDESSVDLEALSEGECTEATTRMFDYIDVVDTPSRARLVREVVAASFGWPQHLNRAQAAMCRELLREGVDGDLANVDLGRIRQSAGAARTRYYAGRLEHPTLSRSQNLMHHIIVAVDRDQPRELDDLEDICAAEIKCTGLAARDSFRLTAAEIAEAAVDKGVVCETDRGFVIPIPSMTTWAREKIREREESGS